MINTEKPLEKLLQYLRFNKVIDFIYGDVLDFGGNKGELKVHVKGEYTLVNYDHSKIQGKKFDTIVALAVIEHIEKSDVFEIFKTFKSVLRKDGKVVLTTPTKLSKPVLKLLSYFGILDKENIMEHKHYWTKNELIELGESCGLKVTKYRTFQCNFNQFIILMHK